MYIFWAVVVLIASGWYVGTKFGALLFATVAGGAIVASAVSLGVQIVLETSRVSQISGQGFAETKKKARAGGEREYPCPTTFSEHFVPIFSGLSLTSWQQEGVSKSSLSDFFMSFEVT